MNSADIEKRINEGRQVVNQIMKAKRYSFQGLTPSRLPETPGIYVITTNRSEILRIGRTDKQSLKDRIYRNHLMGSQKGNLRAQLVRAGVCGDLEEAKDWIRGQCVVQFLEKAGLDELGIVMKWAEHFLLAVIRPRFSD